MKVQLLDDPSFGALSFDQIKDGLKKVLRATSATSVTLLFTMAYNLISLILVSQLRNTALVGGLGVGFVWSNCFVYILIMSIDQGINVLCGQAFGAKNYEQVKATYHRGLFIQACVMIPVLLLLLPTKPILMFLGMEEEVAEYAAQYILTACPSFIFYAIFDATKSYLFAQNVFTPILQIQTVTILIHCIFAYICIVALELGAQGAGIARSITEAANLALLLAYVSKTGSCKSGWVPFKEVDWKQEVMNKEEIKKVLRVVIPIAAILFLDMACYEIFTILAGLFGEEQLAVHVALANSSSLFYMVPLGISVAVMTFTSNDMGSGAINRTKNDMIFGIIVDLIITLFYVLFMFTFKHEWATIFSADERTKKMLLDLLSIYLCIMGFDGVQVTLSGVIKGIGKQKEATYGMIIAYYLVALPLIYFLAFILDLRVKGIWLGFGSAIVLLFVFYIYIVLKTNFKEQADKIASSNNLHVELI